MTTSRLSLHQPAASALVSVVQDLNENLDKIDAAVGFVITTALPSDPFSGKGVAVSGAGPVFNTYFSNGTSPASASFVEIPNASGTFGSDIKLAAGQKLIIGSDTNLYRLAANVLATDDSLQVGGDLKLVAGGTIYRNKLSAVTTVANTTSETAVATMTIPAGDAVVGAVYRIRAWGIASVTGTPTITFRTRIGGVAGTSLASSGARTASSGISNHAWRVDALLTCISTGAGGTGFGSMLVSESVSVAGSAPFVPATILDGTATGAWDTTASKDFVITVQWSAASSANTATCEGFIAERVA